MSSFSDKEIKGKVISVKVVQAKNRAGYKDIPNEWLEKLTFRYIIVPAKCSCNCNVDYAWFDIFTLITSENCVKCSE